jgi:hypothetical protein
MGQDQRQRHDEAADAVQRGKRTRHEASRITPSERQFDHPGRTYIGSC